MSEPVLGPAFEALLADLEQARQEIGDDGAIVPPPGNPIGVARVFISQR